MHCGRAHVKVDAHAQRAGMHMAILAPVPATAIYCYCFYLLLLVSVPASVVKDEEGSVLRL